MFTPDHPAEPIRRPALSMRLWGRVMHFACQHRNGFTLIEVMVVVVIIAILAGMMGVAVNSAKEKARQTDCMSNLRQLGTAIVTYRADNRGRNPDWLSNLYPTYIDDTRIYVCRSDKNKGRGDCRPPDVPGRGFGVGYNEAILNDYGGGDGKNPDVKANSYMYEFSAAICPWPVDGQPATWNKWKENQLAKGDANNGDRPYSSSRMPIVRCYHHTRYGKIRARDEHGALELKPITLNVAYAGNVIIAPLWWEGALEPGEEKQ